VTFGAGDLITDSKLKNQEFEQVDFYDLR